MPYPRSHGKSEKEPILETRSPDSWLSVYWAIFIHTTIPFEFSFSPSPPHQNSLQKGNFTRHSHSVIDPSNRKDPVLVPILGDEGMTNTEREREKKKKRKSVK